MLHAEEDCYTKIQRSGMLIAPSVDGWKELGVTDGGNVNDIIRAGAFVKLEDKEGRRYVQYFCPEQLPRAKF